MAGTAPDATVVPLRVFWWDELEGDCDDDGELEPGTATLTTTTGDILAAIAYAAEIGADAINMSLGTPPLPPQARSDGQFKAYQSVVQWAVRQGSVVVASAGNAEADLQHGGQFSLPNSLPGAMSISATGPNDELSYYSNYGTNEVDVGAPGGGYETEEKTEATSGVEWPYPSNLVLSAADPDSFVGLQLGGAQYIFAAGTSMAAPQVAGTVALLREIVPDANPKQIEQAIKHGSDLVQGSGDPELGSGRLNVADALEAPTIGGGGSQGRGGGRGRGRGRSR